MSEIENNNAKSFSEDATSSSGDRCTSTGVHSLVGETVDGKYRVISILGSGGMGAVYKAEHSLMDRIVALKVLHPHLVENEDLLKRFQHEARVASKIAHRNAVSIYDFGVWRSAPFLVMEFVEGETLKEYRARNPSFDLREIQNIFVQVCAALAEAHELGIVHRDLKPDNIMLTKEPDGNLRARVLDFGIAKVLSEKALANQAVMTQTGTFFGTPKYASPEQALEKTLDGRSDIYTIGIIIYELVSGQVPFEAPSLVEILMKLVHDEPVPLRKLRPELKIPEEVDHLVMKCLAKKPDERFQSMDELQTAISQLTFTRPRSRLPIAIGFGAAVIAALAFTLTRNGGSVYEDLISRTRSSASSSIQTLATLSSSSTASTLASSETSSEATAFESQSSSARSEGRSNPLIAFALKQVLQATIGASSEASVSSESFPEDYSSETFSSEIVDSYSSEALSESSSSSDDLLVIESPSSDSYSSSSSEQLAFSSASSSAMQSSSVMSTTSSEVNEIKNDIAKLESGKKEATALYNAGRKLLQKKRYGEAAAKFEEAVRLRPDAVGSYISLGNCYLRLGQNDRALFAFKSAVKNDPSYGPSHYNLAAYYALVGDSARALESLGAAIRLDASIRSFVRSDPDFSSVKNLPGFKKLTER